jgi:hypothetical protein
MRQLRSTCVLSISMLFSAAPGEPQVPTEHPELIGGAWEVASASGIDGVLFEIETSSSGSTGHLQFDWQTMNIRVIRQSRDGALCAWSNRITSAIYPKSESIHNNQSNGVWLKVSSATEAGLVLDTTNAMGPPSQFRGTLSEDHQVLTGSWERTGGGRLSSPDRFRRAPSPAAQ